VVGGGAEAPRLAAQARRLALGERVLFAGPQTHDRVADWMAAADAVVLASEREGTPTTLVEALGMGVPVVATRVGGIPDLVGPVAPLVEPGNPAAFAAAVATALADPPAAAALRARVAHLAWPSIGAAEAEFLAQCLERGAPAHRPAERTTPG
jgi:glycosyltransferase involved in cell wall biosynthesis